MYYGGHGGTRSFFYSVTLRVLRSLIFKTSCTKKPRYQTQTPFAFKY